MQQNNSSMRRKKPKIALVLGSGGAKGFAHIGVIKAFEEAGIKFDMIVGCSMGAIVGCCYAMGISSSELENKAISLSNGDVLDVNFPNAYGFVKGNKAERVIRQFIGAGKTEPQFSDCKIPFACVAADIGKAELVVLKSGPIVPAVRASFSIGGVFRPVEIDGRKLLDGGVFSRVPVDTARNLGAEIVIAIDCIGETKEEDMSNYKYSDTIARVFNIMDYQVSRAEIKRADYLISLDQPMVSSIRIKNIEDGIRVGYETTKANIIEVKNLIQMKKATRI